MNVVTIELRRPQGGTTFTLPPPGPVLTLRRELPPDKPFTLAETLHWLAAWAERVEHRRDFAGGLDITIRVEYWPDPPPGWPAGRSNPQEGGSP